MTGKTPPKILAKTGYYTSAFAAAVVLAWVSADGLSEYDRPAAAPGNTSAPSYVGPDVETAPRTAQQQPASRVAKTLANGTTAVVPNPQPVPAPSRAQNDSVHASGSLKLRRETSANGKFIGYKVVSSGPDDRFATGDIITRIGESMVEDSAAGSELLLIALQTRNTVIDVITTAAPAATDPATSPTAGR